MSASKRKRGRPSKYTNAIAAEICTRLAAGESLRSICRDTHMPTDTVVQEWVRGEPRDGRHPFEDGREDFAVHYARAKEAGLELMAEEILQIADADYTGPDGHADNALVQQARLRVDSRRWLLSKLMPKKYGDKVTQEITGDAGAPLVTRIELVAVYPPARPEELPAQDDGDETVVTPLRVPSR